MTEMLSICERRYAGHHVIRAQLVVRARIHTAHGERARRRRELHGPDLRVGIELARREGAVERRAREREQRLVDRQHERRGVGVEVERAGVARAAAELEQVRHAEGLLQLGDAGRHGVGTRDHLRPAKVHAVEHRDRAVGEIEGDRQRAGRAEASRDVGEPSDVVGDEAQLDPRRAAEPTAVERRDLRGGGWACIDRRHALPHARLGQRADEAGQGQQREHEERDRGECELVHEGPSVGAGIIPNGCRAVNDVGRVSPLSRL